MKDVRCEKCGAADGRRYQTFGFEAAGVPVDERHAFLCVKCARAERRRLRAESDKPQGLTRDEVIAELNRFFAASGALEICRRCHAQGTGCCPPTCRSLTPAGCADKKTLWCAGFVCSALLGAIAECDAEAGRALKWLRQSVGVTEYRIYEMKARVPAAHREPERPLALPARYPFPPNLGDPEALKPELESLAEEVLEVRRRFPGK
jgi:hypothetical protein